jgi:hypothetical protein
MIRSRNWLLAGTSMTAAERAQGRFMRAPDHPKPADAAPAPDPAPDPAPGTGPRPCVRSRSGPCSRTCGRAAGRGRIRSSLRQGSAARPGGGPARWCCADRARSGACTCTCTCACACACSGTCACACACSGTCACARTSSGDDCRRRHQQPGRRALGGACSGTCAPRLLRRLRSPHRYILRKNRRCSPPMRRTGPTCPRRKR